MRQGKSSTTDQTHTRKGEGNENERRTRGPAAPREETRKTSKSKINQHKAPVRAREQESDQGKDTDSRSSAHFSVLFATSSRFASKSVWQLGQETEDTANGTGRSGTTTATTRSAKDEWTARRSAWHAHPRRDRPRKPAWKCSRCGTCRTCQRIWDPTHDKFLNTDGIFKEMRKKDDKREQGANAQNEEEKDSNPVEKAQAALQAAQKERMEQEIIKT